MTEAGTQYQGKGMQVSEFIERCNQLVIEIEAVTLDNLLDEFQRIDSVYEQLRLDYETLVGDWGQEQRYHNYTKDSLLTIAKQLEIGVPAARPKERILGLIIQHEWSKTEEYKVFSEVRKKYNRLESWHESVEQLPRTLKRIIEEADDVFEGFTRKATDLPHLAQEIRFHAVSVTMAQTARQIAIGALKACEGHTHAEVIRSLVKQCNALVRNYIAGNQAPTGHGVYSSGEIEAAKRFSDEIRDMLPPDQRWIFLAY
jgi:hypothetical protein